jgi:hypothetical protein
MSEARTDKIVAEAHAALEDPTARGAFLCALATKLSDANRLSWMEEAAGLAVAVAVAAPESTSQQQEAEPIMPRDSHGMVPHYGR